MSDVDPLSATFAALAHPARRAILARLAEGDATVNDLAAPFDMSLPAVSRHIKVLEDAGLISRRKSAQFRHCTLNPTALQSIASWADQYRPVWEARFDAMDSILKTMKDKDHD